MSASFVIEMMGRTKTNIFEKLKDQIERKQCIIDLDKT